MARTGTAFILGLTFGIVGIIVIQKVLEDAREDDPNEIFDELTDQLDQLEARIKRAIK